MVTGRTAWNASAPGTPATDGTLSHLVLFYRDQADYLAQIQAFADNGHASGEPVLVAVPGNNFALLRERLDAGSGRLGFVDMAELGRNPARIIPGVRAFCDSFPGQRVRYVSEPVWPGRSDAEMREASRHEALINLALAGLPATILCLYDATGLAAPVVGEAELTHPSILASGQPVAGVRYTGAGNLPPGCDAPLPAPPATAETLAYEADLRPMRRLVSGYARRTGLDEERASNFVLAVSEVAANTLRHTTGGGTVHLWHTADEILCQVQDQGWITDPLAGRVRRPADSRGHGLWVVNQVCDLVELRTGPAGTTMCMHMRLNVP